MLHIYALTPIGRRLARSVSNPVSSSYRVIAHLDQVGHSTTDQIAEYCGMSNREAATILGRLKRKRVVAEVGGAPI